MDDINTVDQHGRPFVFCAVCLQTARTRFTLSKKAVTYYNGTAYCYDHLPKMLG